MLVIPPAGGYRSRLLEQPQIGANGVEHRNDGHPAQIHWDDVQAAVAAEIGEPQGIRTIVFDLIVEDAEGRLALRFDAEPGEAAGEVAALLARALGARAPHSIKSLAHDGRPTLWFPDLESFEETVAPGLVG